MGLSDMLPEIGILQSEIPLYNNLASYKEYQGRLTSRLKVYPTPQILWDFEVLGDEVKQKGRIRTEYPMLPLRGYQFTIDEPILTSDTHNYVVPSESLIGKAYQAVYRDLNCPGHAFRFYLPNNQFQAINISGQQRIEKHNHVGSKELGTEFGGKRLVASLDDTWQITLRTDQAALEWMDDKNNNIGTQITAIGILEYAMGENDDIENFPTLTLDQAKVSIETFCSLGSFLNGGYTRALYIESFYYGSPSDENIQQGAVVLAPWVTPLERLGISWCAYDSDLSAYFSCFQSLKQMLSQPPWDETFNLVGSYASWGKPRL